MVADQCKTTEEEFHTDEVRKEVGYSDSVK
jgi:hypothetical protein